jgi:acetyltransferase-like isoleucine patch superfamily enzyme
MGGRVTIDRGAFVSVGAVLAPRVSIGAGAIVGAGAVVVCDIPPDVVAYGVPARVVRDVRPEDWGRLL